MIPLIYLRKSRNSCNNHSWFSQDRLFSSLGLNKYYNLSFTDPNNKRAFLIA